MKKLFNWNMQRVALTAMCIQPFLWSGGMCYALDADVRSGNLKTGSEKELVNYEYQQSKGIQVVGTVTDANGESVIGATVRVKGTTTGVITDIDGHYQIAVPDGNVVLEFSFIGYQTQEVKVNGRKNINVSLQENVQALEEVTVVAYGVQKKATLTGAISSVGTDALLKSPSASVANSLAGQLPGVSSMQVSGQPGADDAKIFVRGVGSLTEGGAAPLILVDGVERSFSQMDPNEIESINVLKDASATAVFGVRGANGVVLVTTRRGQEGKAKVSVNSTVGLQVPTRVLDIADSYTTALCYNEGQRNDGMPEDQMAFNAYDLERFRLGDDPIMYPNINWYKELTNKVAVQTQHNLNISGGTKDIRYFISLGFLYQNGLFKQLKGLDYDNNYNYSRYNYRANLDVNLTPTTILKFNMGGILGNRRQPVADIWQNFASTWPFSSPGLVDGKKVVHQDTRYPNLAMSNQVFDKYYGSGYQRRLSNNMTFDLNLVQKLDFITKGLSVDIKGSYNTDYSYIRQVNGHVETYTPFYKSEIDGSGLSKDDPAFDKTVVYRVSGQNSMKTYGDGSRSRGRDWYLEGSIRYNRKFGNHSVGALFLYNQSKKYYPKNYSDVPTAYVGFVGRLTYDYKSKYMAEFNIGHNGSENFAPDKRFGTFPAGSIGYILTEEKFFPKNDYLTYLKIRASIGLVGNDNMSSNRFLYLPDAYSINDNAYVESQTNYYDRNGYIFGLTNTAYELAAREIRLGNSNVTWETALKHNYGIDAYFFKDRLRLSVDYFMEKRKDILIQRQTVPYLIAMGGGLLPVVNMGKVDNKGYEIDLKWNDNIRDFSYYINANLSYSKNKIVYQDEVEPNEPYQWRTGNEVGARYGYVALGFYNKDDFNEDGSLKESFPQPLAKVYPGDVKYADLNNDNVIDNDDQKKIGNPKRPAYTFGLNFGAEYKGVFFSMNWTGVAECDIMMSNTYRNPMYNRTLGGVFYQYLVDGRWTKETAATAEYPRFTYNTNSHNQSTSRVWIKDASYVKLKNLTVGYNISNKKVLKAIGASKLAVQFTGYNLLTFDKLKVFDPEGELTRDNNTYPVMKIFSLGVNATF